MANSINTVVVQADIATTFAFVSDFRNAGSWDRSVAAAIRVAGLGPLAVGNRIELVSPLAFGPLRLPYELVEYEPPHRVSYRGANWLGAWQDSIVLSALDPKTTKLTYDASFTLSVPLAPFALPFSLFFASVGRFATAGIATAVQEHARNVDYADALEVSSRWRSISSAEA